MKTDYNFEELDALAYEWGQERDLMKFENIVPQAKKVLEEAEETEAAIWEYKNNPTPMGKAEALTEIGDVFFSAVLLARQMGVSPAYCLDLAYTKNKNRKGKTVNGQFIKDK